jgi:hypothetical protein
MINSKTTQGIRSLNFKQETPAEEVKPIGYQFGDANLFGKQPSIPLE